MVVLESGFKRKKIIYVSYNVLKEKINVSNNGFER